MRTCVLCMWRQFVGVRIPSLGRFACAAEALSTGRSVAVKATELCSGTSFSSYGGGGGGGMHSQ